MKFSVTKTFDNGNRMKIASGFEKEMSLDFSVRVVNQLKDMIKNYPVITLIEKGTRTEMTEIPEDLFDKYFSKYVIRSLRRKLLD
jgi:hypothetical protein